MFVSVCDTKEKKLAGHTIHLLSMRKRQAVVVMLRIAHQQLLGMCTCSRWLHAGKAAQALLRGIHDGALMQRTTSAATAAATAAAGGGGGGGSI
jgi:hypothetical protein